MLTALLLALRTFENWRGERAWANYLAGAQERNVRLSLADFIPPPVPEPENFAAIPVIQEIFAALDAKTEMPHPLTWPENFKNPQDSGTISFTGQHIDLAKWRDALVAARMLPQPSEDPGRDVLNSLVRYEPALAQLHTAGLRPSSRFPVKWERGLGAHQLYFSLVTQAAKLDALRLSAHLALADPAAYTDWSDGLALYHGLEHEPTLIAGLMRLSILTTMERALWDGLAARQWTDPELRAISADLAPLNLLADWQFTVASERGWMNTALDYYATMNFHDRAGYFGEFHLQSYHPGVGGYLAGWLYPVGWFRQAQVKINELFDHRLARFDLENNVLRNNGGGDQELYALKQKGVFATLPYSQTFTMMPPLDVAEAKFLSIHTATQQARLACALELFRRARGAFPERLDELVPDFLDAVPHDVMDGTPLRYRRDGGSFKLWSIALNRQDDAGETGPSPKPAEQLDWVWHY